MRALLAVLVTVLSLALSLPLLAQDADGPDYGEWEKLAKHAEQVIASDSAADSELENLRTQIDGWRGELTKAQDINKTRITTLREQISALGPAPKEGETEADDIAARRKELNDQLNVLQAPGVAAVEALSRANSIISQIDETLRARQASALLRSMPVPVFPKNWTIAAGEIATISSSVIEEVRERSTRQAVTNELKRNTPVIIGLILVAIFLMTQTRRWIESVPSRYRGGSLSLYGREVVGFLVSLGQIILPVLGAVLLIASLEVTGLFAEWGDPILYAIPVAALVGFSARWLATRLFPKQDLSDEELVLTLPQAMRNRARFRATLLGLLGALHQFLVQAIAPYGAWSGVTFENSIPLRVNDATVAVIYYPLILVGSLSFFRLCQVLRRASRYESENQYLHRNRIVSYVGRVGVVVSVVAPVLATVGYITAANVLLWSTVASGSLLGLLILLQDFFGNLYAIIKRGEEGSREALVPVLIGFGLLLLSLPFFALIWGARQSDIAEFWVRMQNGLSLGGIRLSPGTILTFLIVFSIGYVVTRLIQSTFRNTILPKTKLEPGARTALVSGIGYIGIFLATVMAITSAGIDLSSLAIVAGALSVGIGFGMQNIVSNFVSGIILLIERPINVGDWVEAGGRQGYVKRISVRSTRIETFDRTDVIVPNSDLISQPVTNWTRGNLQGRLIVPVGVAYGTDTRRVEKILREIAEDQPTVMINPPPTVLFIGFGADSMDFEVRMILSDINQGMAVRSEVNHQIAERFAAEKIEIPFAQRDLWLRNPETLVRRDPSAGSAPPEAPPAPPPAKDRAAARPDAPAREEDDRGEDARSAIRGTSGGAEGLDMGGDADGDGAR